MRVVEPRQFKELPTPRPRRRGLLTLGVIALLCGASLFFWQRQKSSSTSQSPSNIKQAENTTQSAPDPTGPLKQFTGEQFKELYQKVAYPNTQQFSDPPPITGVIEADNRIRKMAEARGYRLTAIPIQAIVKINEPRLENDDLLQALAAKSWGDIKAAAHKAGFPLTLISAYRSPEFQRELFTQRLYAHGVTPRQVASAQADAAIEDTLHQAALPGYSRHHTGYTIDLWCEDGSTAFLASACYQWVSANNYEHAKEYGWVPSYPEGASEQGPEPEPWEYVWVGVNNLRQN